MASKRATVPAPETTTAAASPAFDELTGRLPRLVELPVDDLAPHPQNPRHDLGDLSELADSIRAHGIRQSLTVVPNPDGPGYRIVIGHRRHAAAALAGLRVVPAIVDESLSPADQLELMLVENIQRTDLSPVEEADGYQGLLDLGLAIDDIVGKTGRSASTVRRRLQLAGLPKPAREKVHFHQGSLGDAELLAETLARPDIAAHPEIVGELTEAYGSHWRFADLVADRVADVDLAESQAKLAADLQAKGIRVIPRPPYDDKKIKRLSELSAVDEYYGPQIEGRKHAKCPGHVAWIDWSWAPGVGRRKVAQAVYGCDDFRGHGHFDRTVSRRSPKAQGGGSSAEQRRVVIANNKAAAAARPRRLAWIRGFLELPEMPAGSIVHAAAMLTVGRGPDYREERIHKEILTGGAETAVVMPNPDTDTDALHTLVAHALAVAEAQMFEKNWWSGTWKEGRALISRHLRYLAASGYELADVENAYLEGGAS